ncbi:adenine/guanine phosphoribosyltransferase-like PRPP-binding protein [Nocardioides zeae]|uniref:Adenine/guanine phosphoribosyltransferase-like PRPP-binding protein n=1 Tax=Nocardioides zeae TaxID=1457234 RepID=A0AAJ1TZ28_9ACTN|nr:adenine/guanine phosphoribosyltransferase-like PRPP-binding protein [Nocardioides zeae]
MPVSGWNGAWVAERLGIELEDAPGRAPLALADLVGLALRVNPKRPHLLVSTVLAKHVPTDPRLVQAAGHLLGLRVAEHLGRLGAEGSADVADRLRAALAVGAEGHVADLDGLVAATDAALAEVETGDGVVLGYAETATALGHLVGRALRLPSVHSTRRAVPGVSSVLGFEESHSHATTHLVLAEDPALLATPGPAVLVDDELSTGRTALATIRALHAHAPRAEYVVAALVDARREADRRHIAEVADELGTRISVVALAEGEVRVPEAAAAPEPEEDVAVRAHGSGELVPGADPGDAWPVGVRTSGRHGFAPSDEGPLADAAAAVAARVAERLDAAGVDAAGDVLVLGTEELMYAPLAVAAALRQAGRATYFSTTTRSPVQVRDVPGYAVRSGVRFLAHDRDADGYGEADRFAYNVAARDWAAIVVVLDRPTATAPLTAPAGMLAALAPHAPHVLPVVLPVDPPGARPLRGPAFGSYAPDEVAWLLQDLSHVRLEGDREERERRIQSGEAHYAESLPTEYRPDAAYRELYDEQVVAVADRVAAAVVTVSELARRERGRDDLVLVSLARAGTPIGILMRRWAARQGWDWPHHAVSIVRDRGIDLVALRWIADRYDPARVLVVDGWTGKGAIARELVAAIEGAGGANDVLRLGEPGAGVGAGFSADLAVLADPGECVPLHGTRDDFLIPSACLNSTVSGLVSRTVLNDELIGPHELHGAKFYAELADEDVSAAYLDAVSARFDDVEAEAVADAARLQRTDRTPTWSGWASAEKLQVELGLPSVNLVKPGVGETTRVLLRRVPWRVVVAPGREQDLRHVRLLAADRGVPVVEDPSLPYSCVGIIRPTEQDGS